MLTHSHLHAADGDLNLLGQYQYFTLALSAKYHYSSSSNVPDRHVRWRWVQCEVKARGDTLTYHQCKNDAKVIDKGNMSAALMPIWGRLERDVWGQHEHKVAVTGAGGMTTCHIDDGASCWQCDCLDVPVSLLHAMRLMRTLPSTSLLQLLPLTIHELSWYTYNLTCGDGDTCEWGKRLAERPVVCTQYPVIYST